jgi:hypothetical protein
LHAAAGPDTRVWDVAIAGNFVRSVDDDDPLVEFNGKNARTFAEKRCLANSRPAQQQQTLSRINHVTQHVDGAVYGAAHPARQSDNLISPIAKRGNTMQSTFDTRTVIFGKRPHTMRDVIEILARDCRIGKVNSPVWKTRFGKAAKIQDDLDKILEIRLLTKRSRQVWWHHLKQEIEVIRDFFTGHLVT